MIKPKRVRSVSIATVIAGAIAVAGNSVNPAAAGQGQSSIPPESGAGGHAYVNCDTALPTAKRLRAGLKTQEDMIARTERQLEGARHGAGHSGREAERQLKQGAAEQFGDQLSAFVEKDSALRKAVLTLPPDQAPKAEELFTKLDYVSKTATALKVAAAGTNLRLAIDEAENMQQATAAVARYIADSGLVGILGGPAADFALSSGVFLIDTIANHVDAHLDLEQVRQASQTLARLKEQKENIEEEIKSLESLHAQWCNPKTTTTNNTTESPRPVPTEDMAKPGAAPKTANKGASTGKIIGGAAAAAGAGIGTWLALDHAQKAIDESRHVAVDPPSPQPPPTTPPPAETGSVSVTTVSYNCSRSPGGITGITCTGSVGLNVTKVVTSGFVSVFWSYTSDGGSFFRGQTTVPAGSRPGTISVPVTNSFSSTCVSGAYQRVISVSDGPTSNSTAPVLGRVTVNLNGNCS